MSEETDPNDVSEFRKTFLTNLRNEIANSNNDNSKPAETINEEDYKIDDVEPNDIEEVLTSGLTKEQMMECLSAAVKTVAAWQNVDATRLKKQIATCIKIIDGVILGKKQFMIDAPTGFGKTLLGLMVIEMFRNASNKGYMKVDKNSYILTPNKFLQDQYQQDIEKFELTATHVQLKGQGNYPCHVEPDKTFASRPCSKISVGKLPEKMSCAATCEYVQTRLKAMKASTTVFNFSYYLTAMNFVYAALNDAAPFKPRGMTVVDEAHVLEKVVQDMFETAYNFDHSAYEIESSFSVVNAIYGAGLMGAGSVTEDDRKAVNQCTNALHQLHDVMLKYAKQASASPSTPIFQNIMAALNGSAKVINAVIAIYSRTIALNFPEEEEMYTDEQVQILKEFNKMQEIVGKTIMLDELYKYAGIDSMVIDTDDHFIGQRKLAKQKVTFRCVKSAELIKRFFLKWTDYTILMSATIGNTSKELRAFAVSNGLEDAYIISNESDFNFDRSPIILTVPLLSMSWKDKALNMPKMLERIALICRYHSGQAGLIHTGNYEFMNALKRFVSLHPDLEKRFMFCDSAFMKTEAIARVERDIAETGKSDIILAGPGLLEGIDLKDEKCRFNCFMKVPYASLMDELVKRKNVIYPDWYNLNTMTQFMQGLGRPVRHKDDWGVAYLLDGAFQSFFNRYGELPKLVSSRLINQDLVYRFSQSSENVDPDDIRTEANLKI